MSGSQKDSLTNCLDCNEVSEVNEEGICASCEAVQRANEDKLLYGAGIVRMTCIDERVKNEYISPTDFFIKPTQD